MSDRDFWRLAFCCALAGGQSLRAAEKTADQALLIHLERWSDDGEKEARDESGA